MLLLLAACALDPDSAAGRLDFTDPVTTVRVDLGTGNLDVVGDPSLTTAHLRWRASYIADTPPTVEATVTDGLLEVRSECPDDALLCQVDVQIAVPTGAGVTFDGGTGNATFDGLGDVAVDIGTGDVTLTDVGATEVFVGTGNVTGTGLDGSCTIDGGTGDVALALVSVAPVSVDLGTGNVDLDVPAGGWALDLDTGTGTTDIRGIQDERGATPLTISIGTGNILLNGI